MKSEYDRMQYKQLTGIEANEIDLDRSHNLKVYASHIYEITNMKPGTTITLGFGDGSVSITRDQSSWAISDESVSGIHDQYQFAVNKRSPIWVGNMYGALAAYAMLWQMPLKVYQS